MENATRRLGLAVAVLGLVIATTCPARAELVTTLASSDTYLTVHPDLGGPFSIHGNNPNLYTIGLTGYQSYTLTRFDLSAYAGQTVVSGGTVELAVSNGFPPMPTPRKVSVHQVFVSWNESSANFYNFGSSPGVQLGVDVSAAPLSISSIVWQDGSNNGFKSWSISAATIQSWIDNPLTNYGLLFMIDEFGRDLTYLSRESGTAFSPRLTFNAISPPIEPPVSAVPEPSAIALVCTALPMGLGLAWKRRRNAVTV